MDIREDDVHLLFSLYDTTGMKPDDEEANDDLDVNIGHF